MVGFGIGPGDMIVLMNVLTKGIKKSVIVVCGGTQVRCWPFLSQSTTPFISFFFSFYIKLQLPVKAIMLRDFLLLLRHVWKVEELQHVCSSLFQMPGASAACSLSTPCLQGASTKTKFHSRCRWKSAVRRCWSDTVLIIANTWICWNRLHFLYGRIQQCSYKLKHIKTFKWRQKLVCYCELVDRNSRLPLNAGVIVFPHLTTIKGYLKHVWTDSH